MTERFIKVEPLYPLETIVFMSNVEDITGIGPAKADKLADNGYESLEDVAAAEPEDLSSIDGVGNDDRAHEFILEAENLLDEGDGAEPEPESEGDSFDLTPAEISDEAEEAAESDSEDVEGEDDPDPSEDTGAAESSADESEDEAEDTDLDLEESYPVSLDFDTSLHGRTFHAAVMRRHENIYTSHQPTADALQKVLDATRDFDNVSISLTEHELNTLHSAVKNQRTAYQGDNLIDHMDALREVEEDLNNIRREHLF